MYLVPLTPPASIACSLPSLHTCATYLSSLSTYHTSPKHILISLLAFVLVLSPCHLSLPHLLPTYPQFLIISTLPLLPYPRFLSFQPCTTLPCPLATSTLPQVPLAAAQSKKRLQGPIESVPATFSKAPALSVFTERPCGIEAGRGI